MEFIDDALGILQKLQTLVTSRRFIVSLGAAIMTLLTLVQVIVPAIGIDVDVSNMPSEEAVAAHVENAAIGFGALLASALTLATFVFGLVRPLIGSYTERPPGFDKVAPPKDD